MKDRNGQTLYEVLQVDRNVSQTVLRGAYHALLKNARNHPDLGGSDVQAQAINEAYSILNDPASRREYDRELDLLHPALGFRPPMVRTQYILICPSCRKQNLAEDGQDLEKIKCGACGKPLLPRRRRPKETDHSRAFRMGIYLFDKGMMERSLREFKTAVALEQRQPNYHYWLGRSLYQMRNYKKARQAFQAASTLSPDRFHFQFWTGQSNYALKNFADAALRFSAARTARPRHSPTLLRLASCHFHLGDFENAIKVLETAISYEPSRLQLHTLLGVIHLSSKNSPAALQAFQHAERINPGDARTRRYIDLIQER